MWMKKIMKFFDKLEDKTRSKLSHYPFVYAFLGGIGVILFWRGIWYTADIINISSAVSVLVGSVLLLITGVFVSAFIGNSLIISGLSGGKKLTEKAKEEIDLEEHQIEKLQETLNKVSEKVSELDLDIKQHEIKKLKSTLEEVKEKASDLKTEIKEK